METLEFGLLLKGKNYLTICREQQISGGVFYLLAARDY
jgi:hypothetical protein